MKLNVGRLTSFVGIFAYQVMSAAAAGQRGGRNVTVRQR